MFFKQHFWNYLWITSEWLHIKTKIQISDTCFQGQGYKIWLCREIFSFGRSLYSLTGTIRDRLDFTLTFLARSVCSCFLFILRAVSWNCNCTYSTYETLITKQNFLQCKEREVILMQQQRSGNFYLFKVTYSMLGRWRFEKNSLVLFVWFKTRYKTKCEKGKIPTPVF